MQVVKYTLSTLAIAISAMTTLSANADPTFYGLLVGDVRGTESTNTKTYADGTVEKTKKEARPQLFDNGSRLGVRGEEKLNDTYEFQYRAEWRSPVDSDARNWEPRDIWVGVKHKDYGTLKAGRLLSPEPYIRYTWGLPTIGDGHRSNNAVRYESPTVKDTQVMVHYVIDENNETDSHDTDSYSVTVNHSTKDYGIGGAYLYANGNKVLHGIKFKDQFRTTGFYNLNDKHQVNFIYQQNRFNDTHYNGQASKTNTGIGVGTRHKYDDKTAFYTHFDYGKNPSGKEGTYKGYSLAGDYKITKTTLVGSEFGQYQTNYDVPAHTTSDGKDVKAHESKTNASYLMVYGQYRF